MKCNLCRKETEGLIHLKVYTNKGIKVCENCYLEIGEHRHKPYSKVMDRLALAEAGYQVNRKQARSK